ncbi:HAVR1 protein, partial [Amia calva]|nr:HAVR1 protein [Amia calva]
MGSCRCASSAWLLLLLTTVSGVSAVSVSGVVGENITLPCSYSVKNYGVLDVCWVRGEIPSMGCANTIISTKGNAVNYRASDRYQLWAGLTEGNVSLAILSAQERDSGTYGCRVEIPGWFNDLKHHFHLTVAQAPVMTTDTPVTSTGTPASSPNVPEPWTSPADGHTASVHSSTDSKTESTEQGGMPFTPIVLVGVLVVVLTSLAVVFLLLYKRKKSQGNSKMGHVSIPELENRVAVEENIYNEHMPADYEVCP